MDATHVARLQSPSSQVVVKTVKHLLLGQVFHRALAPPITRRCDFLLHRFLPPTVYSGDCAGFDECPSSEPLISRCFRGGNCHTVGHVSVTFACQCAVRSPCRCFDIAPQKRSILGSSGMFPSDKPENRFCDVRSRRRDGDSRFGRPVESTGVDRDGGDDDDSVASTGTRGRLRGFY